MATMYRVALLVQRYLSNAASFVLRASPRVKDHHNLLHCSPLEKNTCVRQVVLDKWFPVCLCCLYVCCIRVVDGVYVSCCVVVCVVWATWVASSLQVLNIVSSVCLPCCVCCLSRCYITCVHYLCCVCLSRLYLSRCYITCLVLLFAVA